MRDSEKKNTVVGRSVINVERYVIVIVIWDSVGLVVILVQTNVFRRDIVMINLPRK